MNPASGGPWDPVRDVSDLIDDIKREWDLTKDADADVSPEMVRIGDKALEVATRLGEQARTLEQDLMSLNKTYQGQIEKLGLCRTRMADASMKLFKARDREMQLKEELFRATVSRSEGVRAAKQRTLNEAKAEVKVKVGEFAEAWTNARAATAALVATRHQIRAKSFQREAINEYLGILNAAISGFGVSGGG
jgi:hypothetical protein